MEFSSNGRPCRMRCQSISSAQLRWSPLTRKVSLQIVFLLAATCSTVSLLIDDVRAQEPSVTEPEQGITYASDSQTKIEKLNAAHIPNPVRLHPNVISGGLPEGDQAFAELQSMGIKTIISVDGMTPDLETASKYGLKYIHLPHGYDGIPESRVLELAKAVKISDGPIYIHCHHGKHRSPAAAAAACVTVGLIEPEQAVDVLKIAGTNVNYRGLYKTVHQARRASDSSIDQLQVEFREVEPLPPMAEAMVKIEHALETVSGFNNRNWSNDPKHPDSTAAHEALLLRELYTELLRADYVQNESEGFKAMLADGEAIAKSLEEELSLAKDTESVRQRKDSLQAKLTKLQSNCKACHEAHRDNR